MSEWTHNRLVRRMAQWLKGTKRMTIVCAELSTRNSETPDVIGWAGGAASILIECKVSRSDFVADRKKQFRKHAKLGMGDRRYIAAPKGMLRPGEMPDGWGLLEADTWVRIVKEADFMEGNKRNECTMLMSALRRLEISSAVYVVHESVDKKEPTP